MSLATNMELAQLDSQQGKFAALDRAKKGQFQKQGKVLANKTYKIWNNN